MADSDEVGFGEELRRNRLVREVSLESIASATKISKRHLEALERSDFAHLPAPVFTRGFIRAYAGYLGLDPDEMVNAYLSDTAAVSSRLETKTEASVSRPRSVAILPVAAAVLGVGIVLAGVAWRAAHRVRPASTKTVLPPVAASPFIREIPKAAAAPAPGVPGGAPSAPLALSLKFQEDCWIELFGDERLLFSGMLKKGEDRTVRSSKRLPSHAGERAGRDRGRQRPGAAAARRSGAGRPRSSHRRRPPGRARHPPELAWQARPARRIAISRSRLFSTVPPTASFDCSARRPFFRSESRSGFEFC